MAWKVSSWPEKCHAVRERFVIVMDSFSGKSANPKILKERIPKNPHISWESLKSTNSRDGFSLKISKPFEVCFPGEFLDGTGERHLWEFWSLQLLKLCSPKGWNIPFIFLCLGGGLGGGGDWLYDGQLLMDLPTKRYFYKFLFLCLVIIICAKLNSEL